MSNPPIIVANQLQHFFGKGSLKKQVLFNINLEVEQSEIVIMNGPSGSGKTTLLSLIGGLRSVQLGSLKILGRELNRAEPNHLIAHRRKLGYIFQEHNLLQCLTALQNVVMSLELQGYYSQREAYQKAKIMLSEVGLGKKIHYYPEGLSGGEKQRVAVARALVNHPQLILADEPTASLDSKSGRDVVSLLQRLATEQKCTILLVTHDNRIFDIADRLIYMEDGLLQA
ncbi:MAG: ATP-binding cassette domain-containing protein [Microcystis sp. M015S2]|jgi:putative ABC transport system ATP-binding protein|uniref:ATP-binding cassette domain-containing protein n=1 Tax=unclassified Microcystis TaxID=2643300 RepID=UPI0022C73535|nr:MULTISPECIES: ATP-binding cassette domain-containing protein [unclassified Microcystis]MCZ8306446.1 ATP-binding cassette domain-containing protein [Microcystis sp. LE19-98.1E]MCA2693141.1 ATP-binding cassette domain-containing protein [Microcystis sp. M034S2]MCA2709149.1 ATP-binding cassette domain-containing protein [Microcystis sp. M025S2]MCA2744160.1 ATP-binding cassette domain-containing protein [Microcystis sp. M015S2]MCA2751410.1 ATP-binding cassette domain-containing protein [Microcy